jgi:hypothetical protein
VRLLGHSSIYDYSHVPRAGAYNWTPCMWPLCSLGYLGLELETVRDNSPSNWDKKAVRCYKVGFRCPIVCASPLYISRLRGGGRDRSSN